MSQQSLDEARREAIQNALATARLYADAGGFQLGRILTVSEIQGYRPMPVMAQMARAGFLLNLAGIAAIVGLTWLLVGPVFSVGVR